MPFAETVVKGPVGSLMKRWSSHRTVRECSLHPCKGFRRVSGVNLVLELSNRSAATSSWSPNPCEPGLSAQGSSLLVLPGARLDVPVHPRQQRPGPCIRPRALPAAAAVRGHPPVRLDQLLPGRQQGGQSPGAPALPRRRSTPSTAGMSSSTNGTRTTAAW